jgi:hypothetical protein
VLPYVIEPVSNGVVLTLNLVMQVAMLDFLSKIQGIYLLVLFVFNLPPESKQKYQQST